MTMLYPSIDLLMKKVDSKYKLVTVVEKRARQLQDGSELMVNKPVSKKFVGQALEEIAGDKVELVEEEK
jgi:DNA-directed RNA polymerase subunit omega